MGEKEDTAEIGGQQNAFIGRTRELSELRAALEESIAGRGGCFLISGEPGIGKTRLADELAADAALRGVRVAWGRCWEGGGAPAYWPWVEIVRTLVLEPGRARQQQTAVPPEIGQLIPELAAETIEQRPSSDPEQGRFRLFDTVATLVKQVARATPLVLILDDLHEADRGSLELLKFVARGLTDSRVVIVGTYRDAEVRRSSYLAESISEIVRHGHSMPLAGLAEKEVTQMIEHRAERSPSASFASELHRVTAGNPLFVDGVIRVLVAERKLGTAEHLDLSGFTLPEGVRGAIGKRLALLSAEARSILTIGAILGQEFDLGLHRRVSNLSVARTDELICEATEVGLLTLVAHDRYRFTHPLIREALYKSLSDSKRMDIHRLAGEALEEIHAADLTPHLAALAHHFVQAAEVEKAIDCSFGAGQAAERVEAYEQAMLHYENGLRLIEIGARKSDQKLRADFLSSLGLVRAFFGLEARRGIEECETAIELYEKLGLNLEAARIHSRIGHQLSKDDDESMTDMRRAIVHLERAQREFERGPESTALVWHYMAISVAAWRSLDVKRGLASCQRGVEMSVRLHLAYEIGLFKAICKHLNVHAGRIAEALAPLAVKSSDAALLSRTAGANGETRWRLWNPADAKPWLAKGLAEPGLANLPLIRQDLMAKLATANVMTGSLEEARALVDQVSSTLLHGIVALYGGDWSEAKSTLESGLARAIASGAQERQADLTFCSARLLRISGENARAIAMLEDLLQTLGDGSLPLVELWLRPECVLCHAQDTNLDGARLHLARCREIIGAGEDWLGLAGAVVRAEAVVAAMEKRLPDAETFFERAIATFTHYSLPWEQAETLLQWGRVLAAGHEDRANEKFDAAIEIYRRYGAGERWLERVQEARRHVRDEDRTVEDQSTSSLSPAENVFRKDGDFWTVTHGEKTFRLRNLKGLEYIAYLLAHPGVRIHACDLVAVVEGRALHDSAASVGHAQAQGLVAASNLGDAGEALDAQAVSSYRRRLTEVRAELAEAERNNDTGAKERAQREFEALSHQLASAVGRHGRVRRSSSHIERARALVTKNIRASVERIRRNDAKLAEHFASSIRTGAFCAYLPQLEDKQSWQM